MAHLPSVGEFELVTLKRKGAKVHRINPENVAITLCRWGWSSSRQAIPIKDGICSCSICARRFAGRNGTKGVAADPDEVSSESAEDQSTTEAESASE